MNSGQTLNKYQSECDHIQTD